MDNFRISAVCIVVVLQLMACGFLGNMIDTGRAQDTPLVSFDGIATSFPTELTSSPTVRSQTESPQLPTRTLTSQSDPSMPPTSTLESISPGNEAPCNPENWRIIPTDVDEYSIGDGWKFVVVNLAIHNTSQLWGSIRIGNVSLSTEGGFVYTPHTYSHPDLPDGLERNFFYLSENLPPNFAVRGDNRGYRQAERHLNFVFRVAESQEQFTLGVPSVTVSCLLPNGEVSTESGEALIIDINRQSSTLNYPTDDESNLRALIGSPVQLPGIGVFNFSKVERDQTYYRSLDAVFLYYTFTNASEGYDVSGFLDGYIVGDDGIVRYTGCPMGNCTAPDGETSAGPGFGAGPAQSRDGVLGIRVPIGVENLKYILIYQTFHMAFDLPF